MMELSNRDEELLVPVEFGGSTVYMAVRGLDGEGAGGEEHQIAARAGRLDRVLDGVSGLARETVTRLQADGSSKITVQFGFEVAVESGSFVAVIGKASTKSTMTVSLEWTAPTA